jgi:hypothetical protein
MRMLSVKEIRYNREHSNKQGFYRYDEFSEISDDWNGKSYEYTYFTDAPYPLWERPQFLGDKLAANKFYGTVNDIGFKGLIIDSSYKTGNYKVACLYEGFTVGNYFEYSMVLNEIKKRLKIYEFSSLLELAKWAEEKD